jgi:hypothetical protein
VARRVEFIADLPSQVAESGLRGAGLYPRSRSGYGFRYRFAETGRSAFAAGLAVVPPASLYAPTETQPKYALDVASMYRLTRKVTIKEFTQASTSHSIGFGGVLPVEALGADIAQSPSMVFSTDVGTRVVTARARTQSFGEISVKRLLDRKLAFNVGLGTTFNPVANTKAHYLSAGLTLRPT